jgi:hypothetical protein
MTVLLFRRLLAPFTSGRGGQEPKQGTKSEERVRVQAIAGGTDE